MSAQAGNAITLAYGPQGTQQAGDGLVLSYSPAVAVSRKLTSGLRAPWGAAKAQALELHAPYVPARPVNHRSAAIWGKHTKRTPHETHAPWGVARNADTLRRARWGRYASRQACEQRAVWGVAFARDAAVRIVWGEFAKHLTPDTRAAWGTARPADVLLLAPWGMFSHRHAAQARAPWAAPRHADAERWVPWTRFSKQLAPGWGVVVPTGEPPTDEHGTVIVPIRRVYVTINTLTLTRASDGALIPCAAFGMSLDVDSWTWQWSANLHADALPLITPGPGGDPVDLLATVNGTPYTLCAEGYTRQRQFASTRISVQGRGRAAILDAPYASALNYGNTAPRTAQQLMADVLTINGVGIGWDVEWNLTDWLVPGNVWALQGPYIAGIMDIAGAAGGYVQPHDTAQTLRILPRYPAAPWDWHSLTPDYELPASVISVEGTEWVQKPGYNRIYVSGTTEGMPIAPVTRAGTAGGVLAPMVTHPLITHADAARQRGIAELSDTGRQARLSLRLPVLEETGVIKPGALVRYVDNGVPTLGLVRGTQIEWSRPTLRQVLAIETHPE